MEQYLEGFRIESFEAMIGVSKEKNLIITTFYENTIEMGMFNLWF